MTDKTEQKETDNDPKPPKNYESQTYTPGLIYPKYKQVRVNGKRKIRRVKRAKRSNPTQ